jgi:hypothetical protein
MEQNLKVNKDSFSKNTSEINQIDETKVSLKRKAVQKNPELTRNAKKRTMDINNCSDAGNLLHAYVYFLNNSGSKHLSVGFRGDTFEPVIKLQTINKKMLLSSNDWIGFYIHVKESEGMMHYEYKVNKRLTLKVSDDCTTIQLENVKICLDYNEWKLLEHLSSFLQKVIVYNYTYSNHVNEFYDSYFRQCLKNGTRKLSHAEFFEVSQPNIFNFNRLFEEIPAISKNRLENDLIMAKIVKDAIISDQS